MSKILIVDDDKDILQVVELLLSMHNYIVKTIFKAEQTLNEINKFNPDIILLDVNIGGHDGRQICKLLKSARECKDIPVILFSASPELKRLHVECGANDFLSKPFDASDLINKIKQHIKAA